MGISAGPVACLVYLQDGTNEGATYAIQPRYYEQIRDALDRNESGWIEVESVHSGGKLFMRLDKVQHLFYAPPEYCEAREAFNIEELRKEQLHGA